MNRILLLLGLVVFSVQVRAEGSKNLTPNSSGGNATGTNDYVGYLLQNAGGNSNGFLRPGAPRDERLYVIVKPGETLYYGVQRAYSYYWNQYSYRANLRIRLKYDNGATIVPVQSTILTADAGSNYSLAAQQGVIGSSAQVLAGPSALAGASGYNALSWTNTTGQTRHIYIEFTSPRTTTVASDEQWEDVGNPQNLSYYNLWDFTVVDAGGVERTGRLYSQQWAFTTANYTNRLAQTFSLHATLPAEDGGYYVKKVNYFGAQPYEAIYVANSTGTDPTATGHPAGSNYTDWRKSQNTFASADIYPEYPLFINDPDPEFYPTASTQAISTVATNAYCDAGGNPRLSLNLYSSKAGVGLIMIDLDQDGVLDTEDRLLEQPIIAGNNYFYWDGLDGTGNPVASGTQLSFTFRSNVTAVHFPIWDAESNSNGITVQKVRPGISGEYEYLYYDDSKLNPAIVNVNPLTQLEGDNSAAGAHIWIDNSGGAGGGNARILNTFTYGSIVSQTITTTFTYNCNPDVDGDGVLNDVDADNDNDGLSDADELGSLSDPYSFAGGSTTGYPRYLDYSLANFVDYDNNGIDDRYDVDGDGLLNIDDTDADGDGLWDAVDNNNARTPGGIGGYDNATGTTTGADGNGNGMADAAEGALSLNDRDGDGIADSYDIDADNDGVLDLYEGTTNTRGGGGRDYWNIDSDGDGVNDIVEAGGADADNDGRVDTFVDLNGNGLADMYESRMGGTDLGDPDADGDGLPNRIDLDSDNDGIPDSTEGGADFDGDGVSNLADLDSDNDGIYDVVEAGGTANANARLSGFSDSNNDGQDDAAASSPLPLYNTDGTGNPDYLDADSDGDGISDVLEAGAADNNGDGHINGTAGNTGLVPSIDPANGGRALTLTDTDGNGTPDYRETDSDKDGFPDSTEGFDTNFNNSPNRTPSGSDTDGDGLDNAFDSSNGGTAAERPDLDGDGIPNYQDTDDDGDGIPSVSEGSAGTVPAYLNNPSMDQFIPNGSASQTGYACYQLTAADGNRASVWSQDQINPASSFILEANLNFGSDSEGIALVLHTDPAGTAALGDNGASMGYGSNAGGAGVGNSISPSLILEFDMRNSDGGGANDPNYNHFGIIRNGDEYTHYGNVDVRGFGLEDGADHQVKLINYVETNELAIYIDDVLMATGFSVNNYVTGNQYWGFTAAGRSTSVTSVCGISMTVPANSDGTGAIDLTDTDDDNDGILDTAEGRGTNPSADADVDGILNYLDTDFPGRTDTNGDGIDDQFDADLDGIPNQLDLDSDNDGIPDATEGTGDADGDGLPNFLDRDSDGDGISDTREAGGNDTNGDGIIDAFFDYDNDGLSDTVDPSEGGTALTVPNTDGDSRADYLDLDSDNDGIADVIEAGGADANQDGRHDSTTDSNRNGLSDALEINPLSVPDHDGDGLANYRDVDADNDGIADRVENGQPDSNNDGRVDGFTDANGNGWHDAYQFNAIRLRNTDGDSVPNFLDIDSDNDGIPDAREAGGTNGNNGRIIGFVDTNNDGRKDGVSLSMPDFDGDGILDYLDGDSDNDGITDPVEAGGVDTDSNGRIDNFTDNSPSGLPDGYNDAFTSNPLPVTDTNGDGEPNYRNRDSDSDGQQDWIEAYDADGDGNSLPEYIAYSDDYRAYSGDNFYDNSLDANADGRPNWLEDNDGDGYPNFQDPDSPYFLDSDGNGTINLYDAAFGGQARNMNDTPGTPPWEDSGSITTLPVEMAYFGAKQEEKSVVLSWKTVQELNNASFVVERSADGQVWETIGEVAGMGTTSEAQQYSFQDRNPYAGLSYYRLRQVDFDGSEALHGPLSVTYVVPVTITAYPNPTQGDVFIELGSEETQTISLRLYNMNGIVCWQQTQELYAGMQRIKIDAKNLSKAGLYLLQIKTENTSQVVKLIKQ